MARWGDRTIWHRTSCTHWHIRRFASLPGIVPQQVLNLPHLDGIDDPARYLWQAYRKSAQDSLEERLGFYEMSLSAPYRRVSLNFSMKLDESYILDAWAEPGRNDEIFLSLGMILSIEEASHAVFAKARDLFEMQEGEIWSHMTDLEVPILGPQLGLRKSEAALIDQSTAFKEYP